MKLTNKSVRVLALFVFGLTATGFAWANGREFFEPIQLNGKPTTFYYFGLVKDTNGKVLTDVMIYVTVKNDPSSSFQTPNDMPGHYRTQDVGQMLELMGMGQGKVLSPNNFEVVAVKSGYRQISPAVNAAAPKSSGRAVEISFVMAPITASK